MFYFRILWLIFQMILYISVTSVASYTKWKLSDSCIKEYNLAYSKKVPPRTYLYFHESLIAGLAFRIIGGKHISIQDAPYQVMYGLYCGGSLLAPNWVLTAAHCGESNTFVSVGSSIRNEGTRYDVCAHFTHPGWSKHHKVHGQDYDYQLLLLNQSIPVTNFVRPIAIGSFSDITPGNIIKVSGWGYLKYNARMMAENLERVEMPIIAKKDCIDLDDPEYHITDRMFCAGYLNGSKDACKGDSGGPAISNGKLVGSVSFGVGCAFKDKPGVYANVVFARPWIRYVTELPL